MTQNHPHAQAICFYNALKKINQEPWLHWSFRPEGSADMWKQVNSEPIFYPVFEYKFSPTDPLAPTITFISRKTNHEPTTNTIKHDNIIDLLKQDQEDFNVIANQAAFEQAAQAVITEYEARKWQPMDSLKSRQNALIYHNGGLFQGCIERPSTAKEYFRITAFYDHDTIHGDEIPACFYPLPAPPKESE